MEGENREWGGVRGGNGTHVHIYNRHTVGPSCTSQGSLSSAILSTGPLSTLCRYSMAVSFISWSMSMVARVLALNRVETLSAHTHTHTHTQ